MNIRLWSKRLLTLHFEEATGTQLFKQGKIGREQLQRLHLYNRIEITRENPHVVSYVGDHTIGIKTYREHRLLVGQAVKDGVIASFRPVNYRTQAEYLADLFDYWIEREKK